MNRKSRLIFLVILLLLAWPLVCRAEVNRFWFTVWTTNMLDPANPGSKLQRLDVTVQINDTRYRAPDAITSLVVTAPDAAKTTFDLTKNCWNELRNQFEGSYFVSDFPGGKIPSGTYTATLTDKSGKSPLTSKKKLTASFMTIPTISSPAKGAMLTDLTPIIKWSKITGAQFYDLQLSNVTPKKEEPVYLLGVRIMQVYDNKFTLQTGVLKPGMDYLLRIEARDSDKDMSHRSRSEWINFSTAANAQ